LCGSICAFLFSLSHLGIQTSDDAAMLASAGSLWDSRSLAIPHMEWLDERVDIGSYGPDGQLYSKYGLGLKATAALLYGLGSSAYPGTAPLVWAGYPIVNSSAGAALAQIANVLLGSLVVALVAYELAGRHGPGVALLAGFCLALASPLWLAARGFGSEVGCALGLLLATAAGVRVAQPGSRRLLWVSALGLGLAALYRPSAISFAPALLVWAWRRPRREWLAAGCALAGIGAAIATLNWLRFGSPLASGYGGGSHFVLQFAGLWGYLAAPGRGLLFFAPWVFLLIPAVRASIRERRLDEIGILMGLLSFFVVHAMWREWEGGWAYGPRLLVPVLPVAMVAAARTLARLPWLGVALGQPGLAVQALSLAGDPITVHTWAFQNGASFEKLVWSINESIVAWQFRWAVAPERFHLLIPGAAVVAVTGLWYLCSAV